MKTQHKVRRNLTKTARSPQQQSRQPKELIPLSNLLPCIRVPEDTPPFKEGDLLMFDPRAWPAPGKHVLGCIRGGDGPDRLLLLEVKADIRVGGTALEDLFAGMFERSRFRVLGTLLARSAKKQGHAPLKG